MIFFTVDTIRQARGRVVLPFWRRQMGFISFMSHSATSETVPAVS